MQRTLLLHGPLNSPGVNEVTQYLHADPATRREGWAAYHCGQNIVAMAHGFRALGFKVVYSGWVEDADWLRANGALFDALVLSEQKHIRAECVFQGVAIPNNKEKIYCGSLRGLQEVERLFGAQSLVLRLRSDVAIDPRHIVREFVKLPPGSRRFLVEHFNAHKIYSLPDFMIGGEAGVLRMLYESLYQRSVEDRSYHMSSHVDHSLTCVLLQQAGQAGPMVAMGQAAFDSTVWRGVPRYLAQGLQPAEVKRMFDCTLDIGPEFDIERVLSLVPEHARDRRHLAITA